MVRQANEVAQPASLFANAPGLDQVYLALLLAKKHACAEETGQCRNLSRASVGPAALSTQTLRDAMGSRCRRTRGCQ